MELREATSADAKRLRELAESTMTASYALSPQQLDTIVEERFAEERLTEVVEDENSTLLVVDQSVDEENSDTEAETTVAGFVVGTYEDGTGEVQWLFVDPEHRGRGVGSTLFEAATETLHERGAKRVRATVFEANTEGSQFFEKFEFERTDQRTTEIGDQSLVEHVYTEPPVDGGSADQSKVLSDYSGLPNVEKQDEHTTVATANGQEVYLNPEEEASGTEGPLIAIYTDDSLSERFGYYCGNCGSTDVNVNESERIECTDCANAHAPRAEDAYDDSYL